MATLTICGSLDTDHLLPARRRDVSTVLCLATQSRGNRNELDYSFVNTIKQERNKGDTGDQLQEMVDAEGLLGKGNRLEIELFLSLLLHLYFP